MPAKGSSSFTTGVGHCFPNSAWVAAHVLQRMGQEMSVEYSEANGVVCGDCVARRLNTQNYVPPDTINAEESHL